MGVMAPLLMSVLCGDKKVLSKSFSSTTPILRFQMIADPAHANGTSGVKPAEDEKVPQNHADAEEDGEEGEDDGVPETAVTGALPIRLLYSNG